VSQYCNLSGMAPVNPPAHPSATGRERSRRTRLQITKAASTLFRERGYTGTTMTDIAAAAGVAVQTVYFVFHTKSDLLESVYALAVMGESDAAPPEQQAWYRQAVDEPDVANAVRLVVEGIADILQRVAPLDLAVRTAAAADPDAAAFLGRNEGMRADGYRGMLEFLRQKSRLRDGMTIELATDVLVFLVSPGAYRTLVAERGWHHNHWIEWTNGAVTEQIFDVPRMPQSPYPGKSSTNHVRAT